MRIVEAGGHVWALNLKWDTVQNSSQLSKLKARAKQKTFNVFYTKGKNFGCAKVESKDDRRLMSKKKAVALAALLGQVYTNKIVTVADEGILGASRYWTVFVRDGVVVPGTDVEHADQFALQEYMDSMNIHSIYAGVDMDELFVEFAGFSSMFEILEVSPGIVSSCQVVVEGAVSKQQALALVGIVIAGAYFGADTLLGESGPSPEEIAAQERANAQQQYQQMLNQAQGLPAASQAWTAFVSLMGDVPAAVGQYVVTAVDCEFQMQSCKIRLVPNRSFSVTHQMDLLVSMFQDRGGQVEFDPESKEIELTLPIEVDLSELTFANAAAMDRMILDTVMLAGSMGAFNVSFSGVGSQLSSQYIAPENLFMTGEWEFKSASPAYLPDFLRQMEMGEAGALRMSSVSYELGNQIIAKGSYVVK